MPAPAPPAQRHPRVRAANRPGRWGRLRVALRRRTMHHQRLRRATVVAAAAGAAAIMLARLDALDAERERWGTTIEVVVAARAAEPGQPLEVETRRLPRAVVPPGAVPARRDLAGAVARQRIGAGEMVTVDDVTPAGPLALVPDGWVAVAVVESPASGAAVGERVVVVSEGSVVSDDGLVIATGEGSTLVALPAGVAPLVPAAAAGGGVSLLRVP